MEGFTHNLLRRVYELDIEGFSVDWVETWRSFSDEEYRALGELGTPIEEIEGPMEFKARSEGTWLNARL